MTKPAIPIPVLITLGSNIKPEINLPCAVQMLAQNHHLVLQVVSRVYESVPLNAAGEVTLGQAPFLNAALLIETDYYSAFALKYKVLRFIETCLGRTRTADKFAPRPIDLDIALYGDQVIDAAQVIVPDPDSLTYAHSALPLADISPMTTHPLTGQTLAAIAAPFATAQGVVVRDDIALTL